MSLPWVRLDANIGTHDKVAELLAHKDGARAFALYVSSIGWAGGHATDGYIPRHAFHNLIPPLRATPRLAQLLEDVQLWEEADGGWCIRNYLARQELAETSERKRAGHSLGGKKAACKKHHAPECKCWQGGPITPREGGPDA